MQSVIFSALVKSPESDESVSIQQSDIVRETMQTVMKKLTPPFTKNVSAFTLVELLVVMAIIAILAAFLLPALVGPQNREKILRAKIQAGQIASAIQHYESDYGRLPCSTDATSAAVEAAEDFTY